MYNRALHGATGVNFTSGAGSDWPKTHHFRNDSKMMLLKMSNKVVDATLIPGLFLELHPCATR